jgi:Flp pilus assembly protein TadG
MRPLPWLRRRPSSRGQSLVEFALILPIFLLILFGLFDMGRAVYAWSTINNAAREAARLLIVDQTWALEGGTVVFSHARAEALRQSVALAIDNDQVSIDFRDPDVLDTPNSCEDVEDDPSTVRLGCVAAVTVDYSFTPATPVIGQIIGSMTLEGESRFSIEAICQEGVTVREGALVTQCPLGD